MRLRTSVLSIAMTVSVVAGLTACSTGSTPDAASDEGTFASGDSELLIFGVVPDAESTQNNWDPLSQYLEIVTEKEVKFLEVADYTALIEATISGKVDVAVLSGFSYYSASKEGAEVTPFTAVVTGELTEPGYYSVAVANPSAGIKTLKDFAGKNICFVSETSTSGRLFPSKALKEAGVDPTSGLTPIFAGKHDAAAEKVAAGTECVAGFAEDAIADPAIEEGKLVEIDRQLVPGAPVVYSNALPKSLIDTIVEKVSDVTLDEMIEAGVTVDDVPAAEEWMSALKPVDDAYYDQIRDLCGQLPELESCK